MLARFCRVLKPIQLSRTVQRLAGSDDWAKDRERAAEKEFMLREEKAKMNRLKKKLQEEGARKKTSLTDDIDVDIDEVLADREWLIVS